MTDPLTWLLQDDSADGAAAVAAGTEAEYYTAAEGRGFLALGSGRAPVAGARRIEVLFAAGSYGAGGGDLLFAVGLWTPADFRGEFLAWYQVEHLPLLLECPAWEGCRFVEQPVALGCQFHALHQLGSREALESEARRRSRATPWFRRLQAQAWFDGAFTRTLYCRLDR